MAPPGRAPPMHARRSPAAALLLLLLTLAACTHGGGGSGSLASFATNGAAPVPTASTTGATSAPQAPAPDDGTIPVILVHGITGDPSNFAPVLERLAPGRHVVPALYAKEADALQPGDLAPDAIVAMGYYRDSASD